MDTTLTLTLPDEAWGAVHEALEAWVQKLQKRERELAKTVAVEGSLGASYRGEHASPTAQLAKVRGDLRLVGAALDAL